MHRPPLGCLSFSGILAAVATLLVVAGVSFLRGGVLFSPGELNAQEGETLLGGVRSHAGLSGRCEACHAPFWDSGRMAGRCLECHTDLVENRQDFHAVMLAESRSTPCHDCHTDHHGPAAALTVLDLARFPHDAVGFSLKAHRQAAGGEGLGCSDCHLQGFQGSALDECRACHQELNAAYMGGHLAAFGAGCLGCHDGLESLGAAFDHSRAAFPLQGEHAAASCAACHAGAFDLAALKSTSPACIACHAAEDAHGGQFGEDCAACHTPQSWEGARFDHSLAAFPLTGVHAAVACEGCHRPGADGRPVFAGTPTRCFACHAAEDAHGGQFGEDCAACHTPQSWEAAEFDHSLAAFPLTGAHVSVPCGSCHSSGPDGTVFRGTPQECSACHADPDYHKGLFPADCAACHSTAAWAPARFDHPHTFPLNHGDHDGACRTCHPASFSAYTCYGCHEHEPGRVAAEHLDEGIRDFQDCARCHPTGQGEGGD